MTTVDGKRLRQVMGKLDWNFPQPFGPDGWRMDALRSGARVIVTTSDVPDEMAGVHTGVEWTHASISHPDRLPEYDELCLLKEAVWGPTGTAYQVFAATREHVNIHSFALHLWGRADGDLALPNFGYVGTI